MTTKIKPVEVNVNFLYPLETLKYHKFLMFSGGPEGYIDPKWVKKTTILARAAQVDIVSLKPYSSSYVK